MVVTACHRFYYAFHFQREEYSCELRDGDVGLDGQEINLQVIVLGEDTDDGFLFGLQIREKISFDSSLLCLLQSDVIIPSHCLHEVGS